MEHKALNEVIKNTHQLKIARRELLSLHTQLSHIRASGASGGDTQKSLRLRIKQVEDRISKFERLHSERALISDVAGLEDLGDILIAARIARGLTQEELGSVLGVKMQQIQAYEADRYRSVNLTRLIGICEALDVQISQVAELSGDRAMGPLDITRPRRFPLGEMHSRGWFGEQFRSIKDVRSSAEDLLREFFSRTPITQKNRRRYARSSGSPHEPAVIAWEARVVQLAEKEPTHVTFRPEAVDRNWLRQLARLSGIQGGTRRVKAHLRDIGMTLIVEPTLPPAQIDGAAIRTANNGIAIALTLRDAREEVFWPQLMRTIAHATLHIGSLQWDAIFDQAGAEVAVELEEEADVFAREALIPSSAWASCNSPNRPTSQVMLEDAKRLGVAISVLVWRLKLEVGEENLPRLAFGVRYVRPDLSSWQVERDGRGLEPPRPSGIKRV